MSNHQKKNHAVYWDWAFWGNSYGGNKCIKGQEKKE